MKAMPVAAIQASPGGMSLTGGPYNPSLAAALSLHKVPSRMYPRIDADDFHRPCRITESSGTP